MQPTKFWHELTDQQQRFLTLLATCEVENIELATQLFISIMPENHHERYTRLIKQPAGSRGKKIAENLLRTKQIKFIEKCYLPFLHSNSSFYDYSNPFNALSLSLRLKDWQEYCYRQDFFTYKIHEIEPASHEPIGEIKKIISYPFGYKDKLLCKMIITQSNPTKTQQRISDILAIAPNTTFYFSVGETWLNQGFLEHTKAIEILNPIAQPKKWLINIESAEPMLLHGREPKPNPMYLQLQNTCFCVTKHGNGATHPEQGWLDILAASPEWKERNLTYKFVD